MALLFDFVSPSLTLYAFHLVSLHLLGQCKPQGPLFPEALAGLSRSDFSFAKLSHRDHWFRVSVDSLQHERGPAYSSFICFSGLLIWTNPSQ